MSNLKKKTSVKHSTDQTIKVEENNFYISKDPNKSYCQKCFRQLKDEKYILSYNNYSCKTNGIYCDSCNLFHIPKIAFNHLSEDIIISSIIKHSCFLQGNKLIGYNPNLFRRSPIKRNSRIKDINYDGNTTTSPVTSKKESKSIPVKNIQKRPNKLNLTTDKSYDKYNISLDYNEGYNKTLKIPNIAHKDFSKIAKEGFLDYVVNIGFDFGNSCTKIVYSRATKLNYLTSKNNGNVLNCKNLNIYSEDDIPQSRISLNLAHNSPIKIKNFKLDLLDKLTNLNSTNIYKENSYYFCIYYISCLLQFSKFSIFSENMLSRIKSIEWNINMGIPSDGRVVRNKIENVFSKILENAISLSSNTNLLNKAGINFYDWKKICDRELEKNHDFDGVKFKVFPELYAEALNLYESDNNPGENAILVDVGSVTLDLTFINKSKYYGSDDTNITLINPKVLPLGMEKLIAIYKQESNIKDNKDSNYFNRICNEPNITVLSNYIKENFGSIIGSFYKDSSEFFNLKHDQSYKFYWFGGAREAAFINQLFLDPFKKNSYLYYIKPSYQPLSNWNINIKNKHAYRYSVAYGLILTHFYVNHANVSYTAQNKPSSNLNQNFASIQKKIYGY